MKPGYLFLLLYAGFVILALALLYRRAYVERRTGRETRDDDPKPEWTEYTVDAVNPKAMAKAHLRDNHGLTRNPGDRLIGLDGSVTPLLPVYGCTSPTKCECKDVNSPCGCPYEVVVGTKKGAGARGKP